MGKEKGLTNQVEDNSSKLNLFEAAKHSLQPITADTRVMTNTTTSIGVNSVINSLNLYEAQFTSRLGMLLADQLSHGNENFELQLEPESFGKVRINVSLENSNVEIKMIAENSAAVLALRGGELMLQNIAEQHGLKLSDYSVGMQNNQDGQSSDQKGDLGRNGKEQKNRIEEVEQDLLSDSSDVKYKLNLLA
jgi:flagellar hook-length control protein FliK